MEPLEAPGSGEQWPCRCASLVLHSYFKTQTLEILDDMRVDPMIGAVDVPQVGGCSETVNWRHRLSSMVMYIVFVVGRLSRNELFLDESQGRRIRKVWRAAAGDVVVDAAISVRIGHAALMHPAIAGQAEDLNNRGITRYAFSYYPQPLYRGCWLAGPFPVPDALSWQRLWFLLVCFCWRPEWEILYVAVWLWQAFLLKPRRGLVLPRLPDGLCLEPMSLVLFLFCTSFFQPEFIGD